MNAISASGLALIQEFEGFRSEPTQLPEGWVVGYGHVRVGEAGAPISESEAADLLALDLAPVERLVNALVSKPLTQSQFDALVSFTFSIGAEAFAASQVLRRVNSGEFVAAACAMDAWRKSEVDGELEVVDALVRRRAAEKALFLKQLPHDAAPSVFMRAKIDHAASILGAPVRYARAPVVGGLALARAPQFVEMTVASLAPSAQPAKLELAKVEPAVRLTQILSSEPITEALLLTQVANDVDVEDEDEIFTAHAKPVARTLSDVREATRRAWETQEAKSKVKRGMLRFMRERSKPDVTPTVDRRLREQRAKQSAWSGFELPSFAWSIEHVGLGVLLAFGLGLVSLGASLLTGERSDAVEIAAAAAVIAPGLAAALIAGYGFWRNPPLSVA